MDTINKAKVDEPISEKDKEYLQGTPTRMEVANYVNTLIEQHWFPRLVHQTQLGMMVLQGILLKKNVCTPEEIKEITEEFIKEYESRQHNKINILDQIDVLLSSPFTSQPDKELLMEVKNLFEGKTKPSKRIVAELLDRLAETELTVTKPIIEELNVLQSALLNV